MVLKRPSHILLSKSAYSFEYCRGDTSQTIDFIDDVPWYSFLVLLFNLILQLLLYFGLYLHLHLSLSPMLSAVEGALEVVDGLANPKLTPKMFMNKLLSEFESKACSLLLKRGSGKNWLPMFLMLILWESSQLADPIS